MYKQSKLVKSKCTLGIEICHLLGLGFISLLKGRGKTEVIKLVVLHVSGKCASHFDGLLLIP